jgi:hypothetical protein
MEINRARPSREDPESGFSLPPVSTKLVRTAIAAKTATQPIVHRKLKLEDAFMEPHPPLLSFLQCVSRAATARFATRRPHRGDRYSDR